MSDHARHSPSSLPHKALCPGWKSNPTPGPGAIRGTAIHGYMAEIVRGKDPIITDEDLRGPVDAGKAILADLIRRFPGCDWSAEVKVDTGIPDVYGTADLIGFDPWGGTLVVLDWKTGRGERDDAGSSLQTAAYALGALARIDDNALAGSMGVVCILAELDTGESTEAVFDQTGLAHARAKILATVAAANDPMPALRPSDKACKYCARSGNCPAQERAVVQVVSDLPAVKPEAVAQATAEQAGELLTRFRPMIDLVNRFAEALEARAKELIAAGETVPGWEVKSKNGARDWTLPEDEIVRTLAEWSRNHGGAGSPAFQAHALASPAEIERRMIAYQGSVRGAKKVAEDMLKGMSKPRVSKTLVPVVSTTADTDRIEVKP